MSLEEAREAIMKPLAIVPTYLTKAMDVDVTATALRTLRETVGDACDLLVVDDGSPELDLVTAIRGLTLDLDGTMVAKPINDGFSTTVNVGLRAALMRGSDAVLVNSDIEFESPHWLRLMQEQQTLDGSRPAGIVGARLLYPNGLIQHAGIFFSILYREFDHIYRYGPGDLPEALVAREGPVTGALQYIRHSTLAEIGVYDDSFRLGWEDVDYCVRAWQAGIPMVYQPGVWAYHHESFFRGGARVNEKIARWQAESWNTFCNKHAETNLAEFVPSLI